MCDFRKPYFKDTNEAVPYGGGFYFYNIKFGEVINGVNTVEHGTREFESPLKPKHVYGAIMTGSWTEYFDGKRFWKADEDCPEIYWKHYNPFDEFKLMK